MPSTLVAKIAAVSASVSRAAEDVQRGGAGIGDREVEPREAADPVAHAARVAHVEQAGLDLRAAAAAGARGGVEPGGVAAGDVQHRAPAGEQERQRPGRSRSRPR